MKREGIAFWEWRRAVKTKYEIRKTKNGKRKAKSEKRGERTRLDTFEAEVLRPRGQGPQDDRLVNGGVRKSGAKAPHSKKNR
jgi:hypothetical protein